MKFYGITSNDYFNAANANYFLYLEQAILRSLIQSSISLDYKDKGQYPGNEPGSSVGRWFVDNHTTLDGRNNLVDVSNTDATHEADLNGRFVSSGSSATIQTKRLLSEIVTVYRMVVQDVTNQDLNFCSSVEVSFDDGSTWSTGHDIGLITDFTGTSYSGSTCNLKVRFNISGLTVWTTTGALTQTKSEMGSCGTTSNSLVFGGTGPVNTTEIWNGSSWATTTTLNTARFNLGGCGSTTAALAFGGDTDSNDWVDNTEIWSGSSWATTTAMDNAQGYMGNCGTTSDALSFGGESDGTNTQRWNGSTWATTTAFPVDTWGPYGFGTVFDVLSSGGYTGDETVSSFKWGGSTWSTTAATNIGVYLFGSCGSTSHGFKIGGHDGSQYHLEVERWNGIGWTITTSLSTAKIGCRASGRIDNALNFGGITSGPTYTATTERFINPVQFGFGVKIN